MASSAADVDRANVDPPPSPEVLRIHPTRGPLHGRLCVPGDKSISHRALLFGALAEGRTTIQGLLRAADVNHTWDAVVRLGATVREGKEGVEVLGGPLGQDVGAIECGNSGTTARLLLGALAPRGGATLTGDASLSRRPMRRVRAPLEAMGARFSAGDHLPLTVHPASLHGVDWAATVPSAQVKSAVLLAALAAEGRTTYTESVLTRDHTERLLRAMGAQLTRRGDMLSLLPGPLSGVSIPVPGDPSSAAFWLVAAAIVPGSAVTVEGVGVNPTRTGFLDVLRAMGAVVTIGEIGADAEPTATVRLEGGGGLHGVEIGGALIPRLIDELPALAVAAAFAEGDLVVRDAAELRVKESDRVAAIVAGLRCLGIAAEERADGFVVHGEGGRRAHGGIVESRGDHRIAMAFAVAGLRVGVTVRDTTNIGTSYPGFVQDLNTLAPGTVG